MFYCFMMGDLTSLSHMGSQETTALKTIVTIYLESMWWVLNIFKYTISFNPYHIYGFIASVISALAVEEVKQQRACSRLKATSGRAFLFPKSAICSIIINAKGENIFSLQVQMMENGSIEKMHFEDRKGSIIKPL